MTDPGEPAWPGDAVEVGNVIGAWGVKGWIRVQAYAADPQALFSSKRWFLKQAPDQLRPGELSLLPPMLRVVQAKEHGDGIVAQVHDVDDRSAAEALRGARIFVSRESFPSTAADEFYWVDLIGLDVVNRQGDALGKVAGLIDTGPHSVLRVKPGDLARADSAPGEGAERLIPFVAAYVDEVKLAERRITVDWGLDY
jgi:16S rRNA processing protein RimM